MSQGFTHSVLMYTVALSACKANNAVDLDRAYEIYAVMQRNGVEPDKKFYAAFFAVAGGHNSQWSSCILFMECHLYCRNGYE